MYEVCPAEDRSYLLLSGLGVSRPLPALCGSVAGFSPSGRVSRAPCERERNGFRMAAMTVPEARYIVATFDRLTSRELIKPSFLLETAHS